MWAKASSDDLDHNVENIFAADVAAVGPHVTF